MKKIMSLFVLAAFILPSCIMTQAPIQGSLYNDVKVPAQINLPQAGGKMVEGTATAMGIVGVVIGDCSYETALKNATEKAGAKELKNIVVDHHVKNILFVYAEYTTIVRGVAVK
ncbi:MAG: TRL domain-containing protein [Pseudomonadota bacterium]